MRKITTLIVLFIALISVAAYGANRIKIGARYEIFGVNLSGPEFAPWNGQTFPSVADWDYLASLHVPIVRLPVAWESLQPTLNAALDATYLSSITTALARASARGIKVQVDIHNFSHYCDQGHWVSSGCGYAGNAGSAGTGVSVLGDATLTQAAFVDLWTRLATAIASTPGLGGYGIMNEPQDQADAVNLLQAPNYFQPITGTPWFLGNSAVVTQLASGTNPLGAGYGPAWTLTSGAGFGLVAQAVTLTAVAHTFSCYAKTTSGTETLNLSIGGSGGDQTVTTSWTRFSKTATPSAGSVELDIQNNAAAGHSFQIANCQIEIGSSATAYVPSPYNAYAQAVITAIRAVDTVTPIYVNGYSSPGPPLWQAFNYEFALLTGTGLIFDAHAYFDGAQGVGGGGSYSGDYTSYSINTQSGVQILIPFLQWLTDQGKQGFLGEFNVPNNNTDGNANWLPLQLNFLNQLFIYRIPGTIWFYGSNGVQSANSLNVVPVLGVDDTRLTQMLAVP